MEQLSDRHQNVLDYLLKSKRDLESAIANIRHGSFQNAYSDSLRVQESIRLMLDVDHGLSPIDKNNDNSMGMI